MEGVFFKYQTRSQWPYVVCCDVIVLFLIPQFDRLCGIWDGMILSKKFYWWSVLNYCHQTLQEMLPEARVVYCSATGASEPRNLGYMVRLGLWGDGTSFQNFQKFLGLFLFLYTYILFFYIPFHLCLHVIVIHTKISNNYFQCRPATIIITISIYKGMSSSRLVIVSYQSIAVVVHFPCKMRIRSRSIG